MYLQQDFVVSSLLMNKMVSVPSNRLYIPCASHPNSFLYDVSHILRYLGFFVRFHIYISSPVYSSKTSLMIFIRDFLLEIFSGMTFSFSVSTHASISSCFNYQKRVLVMVLYAIAPAETIHGKNNRIAHPD